MLSSTLWDEKFRVARNAAIEIEENFLFFDNFLFCINNQVINTAPGQTRGIFKIKKGDKGNKGYGISVKKSD